MQQVRLARLSLDVDLLDPFCVCVNPALNDPCTFC